MEGTQSVYCSGKKNRKETPSPSERMIGKGGSASDQFIAAQYSSACSNELGYLRDVRSDVNKCGRFVDI